MAAQIAQWQSAYVTKDQREANARMPGAAPAAVVPPVDPTKPVPVEPAPGEKKKTVLREGGGKKWADDTLTEWDPTHLRLFVGNLAGETTDESLLKAFSRWKSVQKARVIRDKRTTKSKGYGFVSFSDPDDFFQAAKEMNGKYIQSHPVTVSKAKTEIKVTNAKEKDRGKNHNKKKHQSGHGGVQQTEPAYEPHLGPTHGGGVTKPGQKTKNGLRLLG
jgi:RNA recognition motif-containing protein